MEGGIHPSDASAFRDCFSLAWRNPYVLRLAFSAGIGGLLFGYDTGDIYLLPLYVFISVKLRLELFTFYPQNLVIGLIAPSSVRICWINLNTVLDTVAEIGHDPSFDHVVLLIPDLPFFHILQFTCFGPELSNQPFNKNPFYDHNKSAIRTLTYIRPDLPSHIFDPAAMMLISKGIISFKSTLSKACAGRRHIKGVNGAKYQSLTNQGWQIFQGIKIEWSMFQNSGMPQLPTMVVQAAKRK
ncbi:hypothetical protein Tco_0286583 [Tanacetum coccineum]